jgi:pimeloyl-ACP methyl ester carboxylesterase
VGPGAAKPPPWQEGVIEAAGRRLDFAMPDQKGDVLTVVIEGDGRGHDRKGRPTGNPTPNKRAAYEIAGKWPTQPVAWLGRLCQFEAHADPACTPQDWTTGRFSQEAVRAADSAIDQLKAKAGAKRVRLVGWSGGGVIAALLAQRRSDVAGLITFAAPLDIDAWTDAQRLTPLRGSMSPATHPMPANLPQVHMLGDFDTVVLARQAAPSTRRLAGPKAVVVTRPERHDCCWDKHAAEAMALLGMQRN